MRLIRRIAGMLAWFGLYIPVAVILGIPFRIGRRAQWISNTWFAPLFARIERWSDK